MTLAPPDLKDSSGSARMFSAHKDQSCTQRDYKESPDFPITELSTHTQLPMTGWGCLSYSSDDVARHHNQGELQESLFGADGFRGSVTMMVGSTAAGTLLEKRGALVFKHNHEAETLGMA